MSQFFEQFWQRPSPGVWKNLGEWICWILSGEMSFDAFFPSIWSPSIWSHVNENEKKKNRKNQKFNILNNKQNLSGDMMFTKFGINLLDTFWKNGFYERTDDGRPREDNSYALLQFAVAHSRSAKKNRNIKFWKTQTKMIWRNGGNHSYLWTKFGAMVTNKNRFLKKEHSFIF